MKNIEQERKIKIIFGSVSFLTILLFLTVIFLINDRKTTKEKLNTYSTEISILEDNRTRKTK